MTDLKEVGQQFSMARERIGQIEAKALKQLKHPSRPRRRFLISDEARAQPRRSRSGREAARRERESRPGGRATARVTSRDLLA
jgi:RNA polymerase primary sigma factor